MALESNHERHPLLKKQVQDFGIVQSRPWIWSLIRISTLLVITAFAVVFFTTGSLSSDNETSKQPIQKRKKPLIHTKHMSTNKCIRIGRPVLDGYDVVAYFKLPADGKALLGSSNYQYEFNNYTFYFQNENNLEAFRKSPTTYVPQFGGFCAYGISSEDYWDWEAIKTSGPESNPNVWLIHDDKLYLFMYDLPKRMFLIGDVNSRLIEGEMRWNNYTQDRPLDYFNTLCFWWDLECGHNGNYCIKDWEEQHNNTNYDDDTREDADDYI